MVRARNYLETQAVRRGDSAEKFVTEMLNDSPTLLFDFADETGKPKRLRFTDPVRVLVATQLSEVRPTLEAVQKLVRDGNYAAGYVAYEAAPAFDDALIVPPPAPDFPLVWFGIYPRPESEPLPSPPDPSPDRPHFEWRSDTTRADYDAAFLQIKQAIAEGETYQVNYTLRLQAQMDGDPLRWYEQLHQAQHGGYNAFLDLGRYCVMSVSPELFFHRQADRITMRPMKGTRRRGRWNAEDLQMSEALATSEKDRAENLMIVDLLRNDLGRLAQWGTVAVPELFTQERYPTVWQMTSTVTAELRPNTTLTDLFTALFPCGSVTGAPKVTAMRRIAQLENAPRQVYCGSIGWLSPENEAIFNVAIRTALLDRETGTVSYGVGGGITWDSTAEEEYQEAMTKAVVITETQAIPEFELLETLCLESGQYVLQERHLQRLLDSAHYFAIPCDREAVICHLENVARSAPEGSWRVRLLVAQDGAIRTECPALVPLSDEPLSVALGKKPMNSRNRFLYHKTTYRAFYQEQRAFFPDLFDVLLWNEREEITEFTIGNIVYEIAGEYWTPPLESGLLAGTLRAELLATGKIKERVLPLSDLPLVERLWFINSVRGWVPVRIIY